MRHSVIVLLAAFGAVAPARPADAQGQADLLFDCRTYRLENTGPRTGDARQGRIAGAVEFQCDDTTIFAEELTWNETTIRASGDVLVVQEGLRVYAERIEMDRRTRLGTFYNAGGTARLTDRPIDKSLFGTMEPEIMFHGARIERTGPRTYRLTDGAFSTCVQANPRWEMAGSSATVTLDERILLRNAVLRVKGIPVIYVPVLYYPLGEGDRSTGFLIPTYSTSTIRGHGRQQRVLLGDLPEPGRDLLSRLVLAVRPGPGRGVPGRATQRIPKRRPGLCAE